MSQISNIQNQLNKQLGQAYSNQYGGSSGGALTLGQMNQAYQNIQVGGGGGGGAVRWGAISARLEKMPQVPTEKKLTKEEQLKKWLKYKILNLPSDQ
jgi:hypothetical protein